MGSIFVKSLKTFESDITGENREYKVNNAVWLHLQSKYKLTQAEWANGTADQNILYGAYFVEGVLKANGLQTTLNEILENTTPTEINMFITNFQMQALDLDDGDLDSDTEEDQGE